mmetsp:Transcript_104454/g.185789  ORF Transcript_104454/g.185789 Transcript_104454/m.185789 type:complete len:668 (+) Transcript_104454:155-2158(+)
MPVYIVEGKQIEAGSVEEAVVRMRSGAVPVVAASYAAYGAAPLTTSGLPAPMPAFALPAPTQIYGNPGPPVRFSSSWVAPTPSRPSVVMSASARQVSAQMLTPAAVAAAPIVTKATAKLEAEKPVSGPPVMATLARGKTVISNDTPIKSPEEPTLVENTLLFLPEYAVNELSLEPNMDDKGDKEKELWFGRVWELRELLAAQHRQSLERVQAQSEQLSEADARELNERMRDPALRARLVKLAAYWKGAVLRRRSNLSVLDRLKYAYLRGTVIYAHGSGGCSWDNFRLCRMMARMGLLVIAPDGFAYPKNTAMGQMRHKDVKPLIKASDDTDYWAPDLLYASGADGSHTYSTKADSVLDEPDAYRELYEKCFQLRRSELHFILGRLPQWVKNQGFFIGGTSEGAMTVARFDDQRYGESVLGRFINSFSVEYCYFTPKPEAGKIGGQLTVPTLNIIGTKDEYFGPEDSVAKIVSGNDATGYGEKELTGNGYNTFTKQGLVCGLVCVLTGGVHGPCTTHDNFLREILDLFLSRPHTIWKVDKIWGVHPSMAHLTEVKQRSADKQVGSHVSKVTQVVVPKLRFPQKMSLRRVQTMRELAHFSKKFRDHLDKMKAEEAAMIAKDQAEAKKMLDEVRSQLPRLPSKTEIAKANSNYYGQSKLSETSKAAKGKK